MLWVAICLTKLANHFINQPGQKTCGKEGLQQSAFFIRQNDIEDTFKIAEILIFDKEDLINKAVGSWIREAGKKDNQTLVSFLDKYAATMPRVTLRYAIEKLDKKQKEMFIAMAKQK